MSGRTASVGLIVNPAAGKDIRRVISKGRFVTDEEKINTVVRILSGLSAAGVGRVLAMRDSLSLTSVAASQGPDDIDFEMLDTPIYGKERDSTLAAEALAGEGVSCIITLGGDGTNRAVALSGIDIPIIPVSTGTNNVFPVLIEGTTAGLAAGVVATAAVSMELVSSRKPLLDVSIDGQRRDVALIDVAISKQQYLGARAIWDVDQIAELFVTGVYPTSIGLASIAACLSTTEEEGLYLKLGEPGITVYAPVAPGMFSEVHVETWSSLKFDEPREVSSTTGTVAVDGERNLVISPGQTVSVTLLRNGPRVVNIGKALMEARKSGVFVL